jgi:hypothetical protein
VSDALLLDASLDGLSLLDAVLDALLDAALLDALPLLPDPPPQAEITEAPATLTPIALPRRMNLSREIFSFKTFKMLSSLIARRPVCYAVLYASRQVAVLQSWHFAPAYT